jgi:uncharacterized protein CbrC (UPF0167 family)
MNDKIKEIVKQAGVFYSYQDDVWLATNGDFERFAELIVRECAELFDRNEQSELGYRIGDRIYKHFGIK